MSAIEDRERSVIDLSRAESLADAIRQLESALAQPGRPLAPGSLIDIHTGDLLLTPGVLSKIKTVAKSFGTKIETLYSSVPQTQQSALDEGLFVRRQPPAPSRPKFNPDAFMADVFKDLKLPFEEPAASVMAQEEEGISKLSITLEDGTRQEVPRAQAFLSTETVFYRQTLRSGQMLEAKGNIVVVGDAHSGSEIMADGDILIWGFLGGIAHAGRNGSPTAEIRALRIEAVQLRIGHYIARRPDRLFKQDGNKHRGPEVARIRDNEIQIFEDIIER